MYDPGTADAWKAAVASAAKAASDGHVFDGPLRLTLAIYMPRPKAHFRANGKLKPSAPDWPTGKPDRDNLEKAILDAITKAGIWKDDSLVCTGSTTKIYALERGGGARIEIEEIVE
jgi:crossover junction endodeoxyribonuclease RusA